MYWANSLGIRGLRYKATIDKAANYGTQTHEAIERFFKEGDRTTIGLAAFNAFLKWYDIITANGNIVDVMMYEKTLTCEYFGGTLDCLMKINGKYYLIDFKTSNHITEKYFMQLAAYAYMLKRIYNITCDGFIILQLNKEVDEFIEYFLDMSNETHHQFMAACEECFFSLVYAYYNTRHVEELYKELEWK
jgi:predicted RecB family nuclease